MEETPRDEMLLAAAAFEGRANAAEIGQSDDEDELLISLISSFDVGVNARQMETGADHRLIVGVARSRHLARGRHRTTFLLTARGGAEVDSAWSGGGCAPHGRMRGSSVRAQNSRWPEWSEGGGDVRKEVFWSGYALDVESNCYLQ